MAKGTKGLNFTNSPHIIIFSMTDLFPIPNFKKIEGCLIAGTNLALQEQRYQI